MDEQASFWLIVWIGRLWPIVIASVALGAGYKKMRNPVAFFVLALLVCFGVQWIVGQFSVALPVDYPQNAEFSAQFVHVVRMVAIRAIVVSAVLCIPPVWWLYVLLRKQSPKRTR